MFIKKQMQQYLVIIASTIAVLFCTVETELQAQELNARVIVNFESIPVERREDLLTMQQDVESYLNSQQYLDTRWEGERIPVDVSIFILNRNGNRYTARLVFNAAHQQEDGNTTVIMRAIDNTWDFPYMRNAVLSYQSTRFDEFTSKLDFYAVMAIGLELDIMEEMAGNKAYELARQIWQLGASAQAPGFQQFSKPGEMTKYNLVSEITSPRMNDFRKLIFAYHFDALDLLAQNKQQALEAMDNILSDMVRFKNDYAQPSAILQAFFDAKHLELAGMFRATENKKVFQKLRFLDPGNSTIYNDAEAGK
jgi:hypothetical protein